MTLGERYKKSLLTTTLASPRLKRALPSVYAVGTDMAAWQMRGRSRVIILCIEVLGFLISVSDTRAALSPASLVLLHNRSCSRLGHNNMLRDPDNLVGEANTASVEVRSL